MGSRTVSLEDSAYERLKAVKRPGESFSVTINRILSESRPSYRSLAGFLSRAEGRRVQEAVDRMRRAEAPSERDRLTELRPAHGRHSRH